MRDRDYIHPLALKVLDNAEEQQRIYDSHTDGPYVEEADENLMESVLAYGHAIGETLLTPRASAVLAAVEKVMGEGTYCNGWTDCDACEAQSECDKELQAIAAAYKEHADG